LKVAESEAKSLASATESVADAVFIFSVRAQNFVTKSSYALTLELDPLPEPALADTSSVASSTGSYFPQLNERPRAKIIIAVVNRNIIFS
jgi:hypothetical protein